jgi:hypothetical protein
MPLAILKRRLPRATWRTYFRFAFVGNPWDWLVSRYFHGKRGKKEPVASVEITEGDILRLWRMKGVLRGTTWVNHRYQYAFLSDEGGELQVDFVGRFENRQEDFDKVCAHVGIAREKLPMLNNTMHEPYRCYYDDHTKHLVAELYRKDIEYFGYRFEG